MKRRTPTDREKSLIRDRQDGKCAICGEVPKAWEYDHHVPLALDGSNDLENMRGLCDVPCHDVKTRADLKAIAKAKRIARKLAGTWRPERQKIKSRGFSKTLRHKLDGTTVPREGRAVMS